MTEAAVDLGRAIDTAAAARTGLERTIDDVAHALAEAARRWRATPGLVARLAESTGFAPTMLEEALDDVVAPFDATAMARLAERECAGAPSPPPVVAHVLASNVPALALPAVAHALLAGTAVVVKSGRNDVVSAPVFRDALATIDRDLAATVVTTAWPRGDTALDTTLLAAAPLVVLTGSDAALAALTPRASGRVLAFGARFSVAVLADPPTAILDALARDVACWEQRGCLSPHVAFVAGDVERVADGLAAALERRALLWPPPQDLAARAARRAFVDDAAWAGRSVRDGAWGAVVVEPPGPAEVGPAGRTIRLQAASDLTAIVQHLPRDRIECVGTSGPLPRELAAYGVSRVAAVGAMQRPSLAWPRGRHPPILMLLDPDARAMMEDDR